MDFKTYDFNEVLRFANNLVLIYKAFNKKFFNEIAQICNEHKSITGINEFMATNPLRSVQIFSDDSLDSTFDTESGYICFMKDTEFEFCNTDLIDSYKYFSIEDYSNIDISEEGYFQGSTVYQHDELNALIIVKVLNENGCDSFYFDFDYYNVCLSKIKEYKYVP